MSSVYPGGPSLNPPGPGRVWSFVWCCRPLLFLQQFVGLYQIWHCGLLCTLTKVIPLERSVQLQSGLHARQDSPKRFSFVSGSSFVIGESISLNPILANVDLWDLFQKFRLLKCKRKIISLFDCHSTLSEFSTFPFLQIWICPWSFPLMSCQRWSCSRPPKRKSSTCDVTQPIFLFCSSKKAPAAWVWLLSNKTRLSRNSWTVK